MAATGRRRARWPRWRAHSGWQRVRWAEMTRKVEDSVAKNMRVHELAKELGMTNQEVVDLVVGSACP